MHFRRSPQLAAAFILSLALTACGSVGADRSPSAQTPARPAPTTLPNGMGSGARDGEFPRTVTHFGGETRIKGEPTRVAVIATGQLDATLALDVTPIGAARAQDAGLVPDYLAAAYTNQADALAKLVDFGSRKEVDFEKLADAGPDLILANEQGFADDYARLSDIAPTVLTEGEGVNWAQDLLILAAALGKSEQAQRLLDEIDTKAKAVGEAAGQDTLSIVRIQQNRNRIFGVSSFAGSLAERAGLQRPASQQFGKTSQEVSLENNELLVADWIFFATPDGQSGDLPPKSLAHIGGMKPDQIVSVDEDPWFLNAGPTAAMTVLSDIESAVR